ncbi:hypothetical protein ABH973_003749 [Bradyrhizobium ottawaense]
MIGMLRFTLYTRFLRLHITRLEQGERNSAPEPKLVHQKARCTNNSSISWPGRNSHQSRLSTPLQPSWDALDARFLNSAAGSLLGNRDRGKPQHRVAGDSEMETIEPPDCAAPVEIVHGERAPCYCEHPRHRLHSACHLETSTSRGQHSPFDDSQGGDGSLSGACTCNGLGAEIDVRHGVLFRVSKLFAHTYAHALFAVILLRRYCLPTPRSGSQLAGLPTDKYADAIPPLREATCDTGCGYATFAASSSSRAADDDGPASFMI